MPRTFWARWAWLYDFIERADGRAVQAMVDGCGLGHAKYTLIKGRLAVGLAVLSKS